MRDACWKDGHWRSATLLKVCIDHGVQPEELSDLTGVRLNTARLWLTRHRDVIPAAHLRGLLYDLNRRVVA